MKPIAAEKSTALWFALSIANLSKSEVDNLFSGSDGKE